MKEEKENNNQVKFAFLSREISTSSLFRPILVNGRRKLALKILFWNKKIKVTLTSFEWLDSRDQTILLSLVGLAGIESTLNSISDNWFNETNEKFWKCSDSDENFPKEILLEKIERGKIVLETTIYKILKVSEINNNSKNYDRIKKVFRRLSQIGCQIENTSDNWGLGFNLLEYEFREEKVIIVLNSRFTKALVKDNNYACINLEERRRLKSEMAKLSHSLLSSFVWNDNYFEIKLDNLAIKLWGEKPSSDNSRRRRRSLLILALKEISSLEFWSVVFRGSGSKSIVKIKKIIKEINL